jgi:iron complex outermembrane receptor protein
MKSGLMGRLRMWDLVIAAALAAGVSPGFATEVHRFNVPAGTPEAAIRAFASQARVQILVSGRNLDEKVLRPVLGEYSTEQGLKILIADSGLVARYIGERSIALAPGESAQEEEETEAEEEGAPGATRAEDSLGEIVVTSRRREERLQDVPASIAAASSETLAGLNIVDVTELDAIAPGLTFVTKPGRFGTGPAIAIRGVSTFTQSSAVQDSVGIVLDGVPISRAKAGAFPDLNDVARIEVMRGPQGTLFGKNASAGLISITTRDPTDDFQAEGSIAAASYDERTAHLSLSGPLAGSDGLKGRLSLFSKKRDGFIRNVYDGSYWDDDEQNGARAKLSYAPTPEDRVRFSADFVQQDNDAGMQTTRQFLPSTPRYIVESLSGIAGLENDRINATSRGDNRQRVGGAALQWDHTFGGHTVTALASHRRWTQDAVSSTYRLLTPLDEGYNFVNADSKQSSAELRLASPSGGRVEYVVGLFTLQDRYDNSLFDPLPGNLTLSAVGAPLSRTQRNYQNRTDTSNYAAFGEVDFELTDQLTLTSGLRWTHEKVEVRIEGLPTAPGLVRTGVPLGVTADERSADNVSWRAGARWRFDEERMVYVSASTGFKGPGFNTVPAVLGDAQPARPETSRSFEAGFRSRFLQRRVTANVTLYHTTFDDFQAQGSLVIPGSNISSIVLMNAGKLRTQGFEAELAARVTDGSWLSMNATYIDGTFKEFRNAQCYSGQPVGPGACTVSGSRRTQDLSGQRLANTPEWAFNAFAKQEFQIADFSWRGFATLDYSWRSSVRWDILGHPLSVEDKYGLLGASIGFQRADERYSLKVYGKNLTDKFHTAGIVIGQAVTQFLPTDYSRIVGVSFEGRF